MRTQIKAEVILRHKNNDTPDESRKIQGSRITNESL